MVKAVVIAVSVLVLVAIAGAGGTIYVFHAFGRDLPDYRQLAQYEPPVTTRIHGGDGRLIAEYATERRVFVPVKAMPQMVVNAFLAAEDRNFYQHSGIDVLGIVRAGVTNLKNWGSDRRPVGASTITQQVAKNFLLTNEVSWTRKIKEAILSFRIERSLAKDRILELYLNEIYLGLSSYGVASAALNYFNKSLDELSVEEAAYLAGLPKAPSNYHPVRYAQQARERRDYVIGRMVIAGFIGEDEAQRARSTALAIQPRTDTEFVVADYFAEEVRRELAQRYGESQLYKGGLSVRTTLDPRLQTIASRVLRAGLETYDRRHGWRGPIGRAPRGMDWREALYQIPLPGGLGDRYPAVVISVDETSAQVGFANGVRGTIPLAEMKWARAWKPEQKLGPAVRTPSDVLAVSDVVVVPATKDDQGHAYPEGTFALSQIPDIEGSLVALDPHTGRVLAMSGGYDFKRSQFNRVTQAKRQPGSAFKPFVYLAALDQGFTPSTLVLDAPFVIDQGPGLPKWRPANYSNDYFGPSTLRTGLEKSRNLMTVRLAQTIGIDKVADCAQRFGVVDELPLQLSMSLGAGETTLLRLTAAYAMFVNGGHKITPTLIDRIQDRHGRTIFRHDVRPCANCQALFWTRQPAPEVPDARPLVSDAASAYQMVSMLQGVVERGTGRVIREVGKPLAGKTGTTNDQQDAWFVGFSPDLAVGVFIGYDEPKNLGERETGGSVAAPVFRDFMAAALADKSATPFRIPPGIRLVRVNSANGQLAELGERNVILEAFKPGTVPAGQKPVLEGVTGAASLGGGAPSSGTGGLY